MEAIAAAEVGTRTSMASRTAASEHGQDKMDMESQRTTRTSMDEKEKVEPAVAEEEDFPEGGWTAWSVLFGVYVHHALLLPHFIVLRVF
jgi:hypothetical protein